MACARWAYASTPWQYICIFPLYSNSFSSENTWSNRAKFYVKHLYDRVFKVYINNPGHMTKMAAMPIYGKKPSNIFCSRTGGPISKKLGMKHRCLKYYNVYINHDPVVTFTYFTFEWVKLLKCQLNGKTNRKLANGQDIDYYEKHYLPLYWGYFP